MNVLPLRFYLLATFINFITSLILAFILFKNYKSRASFMFGLISLLVAFWSWFYCLSLFETNKALSAFYLRTCMIGVIFIPSVLIHFTGVFTKKNISKWFYIFNYSLSVYFAINVYSPSYAYNPEKIMVFPYWLHAGPLFSVVIFHFAVIGIYSLWIMHRTIQNAKGIYKNQLLYIYIASIIGYVGGSTNYFCWYRIPIPPFLNAAVAIYVAFVGYAIIKYQIWDIHFVIKRTTTNVILIITTGFIIWSANYPRVNLLTLCINLFIAMLAVLYIPKLKHKTENTITHILYKEKYKYQETLENYIEHMVLIPKEEDVFNRTVQELSESLGVKTIGIFIFDSVIGDYVLKAQSGLDKVLDYHIPGNNKLISWLRENKKVFITEEMEKTLSSDEFTLIKEFTDIIDAKICIPSLLENSLMGVITLGEKRSGEMYSHLDIGLLHRLGTQLAITLDYRRLEGQLRKEQELASIGIMSAEISHEMRNLLVAPRTFINLAPQRRNDDEFFNGFGKMAEERLVRATTKINDICQFSTKVNLEYTDIELPKLLEEIVDSYKDQLTKIEIVKEFDNVPGIRGDLAQIRHLLENVIINSIEAMQNKPGGKIRLRTNINNNPLPDMKYNANDWVRIEIKDDGIGIQDNIYHKLFTPFVTTKSMGDIQDKGSGLGLAVAKKIVDLHKGKIGIRTTVDKGTTVAIDLPIRLKVEPKPIEKTNGPIDYKELIKRIREGGTENLNLPPDIKF